MTFVVRPATVGDVPSMVKVRVSYLNGTQYVNEEILARGLRDVLSRGADIGSLYVATPPDCDSEIVGYAMVFMEVSEWRAGMVWYLKNVTVNPNVEEKQRVVDAIHEAVSESMKHSPTATGLRIYTHAYLDNFPTKQLPPPSLPSAVSESLAGGGPYEVEHYYMMSTFKEEFAKFAHSA